MATHSPDKSAARDHQRPVLVTLPIDPAGSSDPGGPVTWPPRHLSSKLAGRCVDLRLRPIPLSPEGVREREFYAPEAQ